MAAPASATTQNFSGVWQTNKKLSDNMDDFMAAQGVGFLKRKAASAATVTLTVKHTFSSGAESVEITQQVAGLGSNTETHALDWSEVHTDGGPRGPVKTQARRVRLDEVEAASQKTGWTPDAGEHGVIHVRITSKGDKHFFVDQIWGFEVVNGERRHVRKLHLTTGDGKQIDARLVYDFVSAA